MAKESLKNKAYNLIKSKIIHCEYAPGTFLNESTLMSEIGSSRTPIREALSKLEQEDLVKDTSQERSHGFRPVYE